MELDDFLRIGQYGLETAVWVSAPILVFSLVVSLAVSIVQAATQINDSSIAFIPKLGGMVVALGVFGHFMINRIAGFTIWLYQQIPSVVQ